MTSSTPLHLRSMNMMPCWFLLEMVLNAQHWILKSSTRDRNAACNLRDNSSKSPATMQRLPCLYCPSEAKPCHLSFLKRWRARLRCWRPMWMRSPGASGVHWQRGEITTFPAFFLRTTDPGDLWTFITLCLETISASSTAISSYYFLQSCASHG